MSTIRQFFFEPSFFSFSHSASFVSYLTSLSLAGLLRRCIQINLRSRSPASTSASQCSVRSACAQTPSLRIPPEITSVWSVTRSPTSTHVTQEYPSTLASPHCTPVSPFASTQKWPSCCWTKAQTFRPPTAKATPRCTLPPREDLRALLSFYLREVLPLTPSA